MNFELRSYRTQIKGKGLEAFRVVCRESDLLLLAEKDLSQEALEILVELRKALEAYITRHPAFLHYLKPLPEDPKAPAMVRKMYRAGKAAGVGPMAAVAGAIAEEVGKKILSQGLSREIVVENGGDIFLALNRDTTVAVLAGKSPLSGRVGLKVRKKFMPCGVCTSSGTVGHSLSLGRADALCVMARDTAFADACATALANKVREARDFKKLEKILPYIPDLMGVVCILDEMLFAWGKALELVAL